MASEKIELKRSLFRKRILEAAIKVFAAQGYEKTTTVQIAETLGMTGPSLYHYFATKDALLFSSIELLMNRLGDALERSVAGETDPVRRLGLMVRTQLIHELKVAGAGAMVNSHLYGPRYLTEVLSGEQRAVLRQLQRRIVDLYRSTLLDCMALRPGLHLDAGIATFNMLAIIQYTPVWFKRSGRQKLSEVTAEQTQAILSMLGIHGGGPGTSPKDRRESSSTRLKL